MARNRHIVFTWLLSALLSVWAVPVWAEGAQKDGLHCGDTVTITATPELGWRFVCWNDGDTINPRRIEITKAEELEAIFDSNCHQDLVPVVYLYEQMLLVNAIQMDSMGYKFREQNVTWYRIVGDMDVTSAEHNDELLGTGNYLMTRGVKPDSIYVTVLVDSYTPPKGAQPMCSPTLYGQYIPPKRTISLNSAMDLITLVPNSGTPGATMEIIGLDDRLKYTIQVYDAVGRKLEQHTCVEAEAYTLYAQRIPGYYLVCITDGEGKTILRYVVKQ